MIGRGKRGNWEKISWISVLPPRIWRDVGWTDPDVPGRDTSSFTTTRWLSHSHVLYVLTELLQLCWTVRRACCSCRATDIVRQVCLHWARQECRLWQMLAGIWECGTLAVLKLKGTWANISWNWVTADTVSPSAGCCTLFKVRDCWMNWRMERQRSRCKGHCGVHLTVLYSVLHMQISSLCYVLFHLCVTCYFPKQPSMDGVGVCNGDRLCSLWGRNWYSTCCLHELQDSHDSLLPHVGSDATRCGWFTAKFRSSAAPPDHTTSYYST